MRDLGSENQKNMILAQVASEGYVLSVTLVATLFTSILTVGMQYLFRSQLIHYKKDADIEVEDKKKQLEEEFAEKIAEKVEKVKTKHSSRAELSRMREANWYEIEKNVLIKFANTCVDFLTNHTAVPINKTNIQGGHKELRVVENQLYKILIFTGNEELFEKAKAIHSEFFNFMKESENFFMKMESEEIQNQEEEYKKLYEKFMDSLSPKLTAFHGYYRDYFKNWTLREDDSTPKNDTEK